MPYMYELCLSYMAGYPHVPFYSHPNSFWAISSLFISHLLPLVVSQETRNRCTLRPYFCAVLIMCLVPRDSPSQKAIKTSACLAISVLRIIPADLPYLSQFAGK